MKNLYALLLHSVGLSISEAAALHKVPEATVTDWILGQESPPTDALKFLYAHVDLQAHAADWLLHYIRKERPENINLCISDDEKEAGTLGWPTPSVMNGAVRRFLEMADDDIRHRTTIILNPTTTAERTGLLFAGVHLKEDGSFADPDDPPEE
ncbi:MAG: helix-turn-helix domain-containing protein [Candidatus Acidiferrales bacterium]